MKSFQSHINEKAGNGTVDLYKKDGQGGYTADDDETNHDCEEEHPGVSHKKWVAASDDVDEAKMSQAEITRRRKEQKRELVRGKRKSGKTSDKLYDYGIRKSEGKPVNVPKKNNQEEIEMNIDEISLAMKKRALKKASREAGFSRDWYGDPDKTSSKKDQRAKNIKRMITKKHGTKAADEAYVSTRSRRRAFAQSQGSSHDMDDEGYQKDGSNPVDDRIRAKKIEQNRQLAKAKQQQQNKNNNTEEVNSPQNKTQLRQMPQDSPGVRAAKLALKKRREASAKHVASLPKPSKTKQRNYDFESVDYNEEVEWESEAQYWSEGKKRKDDYGPGGKHYDEIGDRNARDRYGPPGKPKKIRRKRKDDYGPGGKHYDEIGDRNARDRYGNEEVEWDVAQWWSEETVADFLKRGGKITKVKPRVARGATKKQTMKIRGGRANAKELADRAEKKMQRNEIYENVAYLKNKEGHTFVVSKRDTKGIRGKQDKFSMSVIDKKGKTIEDHGSHVSVAGAKKFASSRGFSEEVEIDEAIRNKSPKELRATARRVKYATSGQQEKDTAARTKKRQDAERKMYGGKSLDDIAKKLGTNSVRKVMKHAETLRDEYEVEEEIKKNPKFHRTGEDRIKGAKPMTMSDKEVDNFNKRQKIKVKLGKTNKDIKHTIKDVTPKGYGPSDEEYEIDEVGPALALVGRGALAVAKSKTGRKIAVTVASKAMAAAIEKRKAKREREREQEQDLTGVKTKEVTGHREAPPEAAPQRKGRLKWKNSPKPVGEAVSVDGRTKGYRDAISRIAARHKVVVDRDAGPETDPADAPEDLEMPYPDDNLPEAKNQYADGSTVKVVHPQRGKGVVKGKVVRHDKGAMGGSPFYVVAIPGVAQSVKVSDHNMIKENAEELDEAVAKKGKIAKAARAGTPPYTIVVIDRLNKVVKQEHTEVANAVPAFVSELRKRYPNHKISVEDKGGSVMYSESLDEITNINDWYKIKGFDDKYKTPDDSPRQKTVGKTYRDSVGIKNRVTSYKRDDKGTSRSSVQVNSIKKTQAAIQRLARIKANKKKKGMTEAKSSYPLTGAARRLGVKPGKNPGFRAKDPKDMEMNDFLKDVSAMIGRGAKPDEVRAAIQQILPLMKKRGIKVTPQQKAALKKMGIKEEAEYIDELSPAQKEKRETSRERYGSKETQVKSSGPFGLKKTRVKRAIRPEPGASKSERRAHSKAVGKGIDPDNRDPNYVQGNLRPDADASLKNQKNRRSIASKIKQIKQLTTDVDAGKQGLKKSNRREEVEYVDEGGLGGGTQSNVAKTGTHSSELNYLTRSKRKGWVDRGRSSRYEKKRASKEARQAGKKETEVDEAKLRIPKETGTPGMTKARGPKTPYEKSKAFIAAHKRDNKGKYPTQAQHDKAIKEEEAAEKKQTGAQKVITKYKKRAADAKQWKKDNNKKSTGIEETANVGDKNAPVTSQDMNYLSDFHKDVYGTRPRGLYKHVKTVGDYHAEIEDLSRASDAEQARVKQDRVDRKKGKATEKKIQKKRTFGPKGGTSKTTLTPAFKKALAKSRNNKKR